MKKTLCLILATVMFAAAGIVGVSAYELPDYFGWFWRIQYDAYRIYVDLEPGCCGVFDELDYAALFDGAEYVSITDSDAAWRDEHPEGDVFPEGYDADTHVRTLTVELYEEGTRLGYYDSEANSARVEKALAEFEAFDFVSCARIVPTSVFDPYGYIYHEDDEYIARINEMNEKYDYANRGYDAFLEYCEPLVSEYDLNGDGEVTYNDVFIAERAKQEALAAEEEYTGVQPADIICALVISPGLAYDIRRDYDKDGYPVINSKDLAVLEKYIRICERDGVEFPGPTEEGWKLHCLIWNPGEDLSRLMMGDADGDFKVNAKDVVAVMKFIVDPGRTIASRAADVNCDGKINARDVTLVMKIVINGSERTQSVSRPTCSMDGHKLSAVYATEIVHNAYVDSPHCEKNKYLVISCGRDGCDYIEKILVSSTRVASCHG